MRVDFMIIGAQKCGTTSLAEQLAAHPEICFCRVKEPGYFHQTAAWQAGLDQYHQQFSPSNGQVCGEASTYYTFLPEWRETHKRLFAYNPDLKLIYIMRQPVERVISNYAHDVVRRSVQEPAEVAVFKYPYYVNRSRYAMQIKPYLELFPHNNVLLLLFEEYVADQEAALRQVAEFLAISPDNYQTTEPVHAHSSVGKKQIRYEWLRELTTNNVFDLVRTYIPSAIRQPIRRMFSDELEEKPYFSPELKQDLWRLLESDVVQIEEMMGRQLACWRGGYSA